MNSSPLRIAFLIPSGIGTGYTGPGIFLKRLIQGARLEADSLIYAGLRKGHDHDRNFMPNRWMNFKSVGPFDQVRWALFATIWLVIDRKKFDAVHFHGTFVYKIFPALICILIKKPYVLVPLSADADMSSHGVLSGNRIIKPVRELIVKKAAHGFALGTSISTELIAAGMSPDLVSEIQNPVSPEFFELPKPDRINDRHIVFIGAVGYRKNALLLLDAVAQLRNNSIVEKCTFFGPFESDEFEAEFKGKCETLGIENLVSHIPFSNDIARFLLDNASVFILPSRQEGIPGALVESIAAGVPCIVTDAGSMAQTVTAANCGVIVEPNPESIIEASTLLLENREQWNSYSKNARDYALIHLSAGSIGNGYKEIIRKLAS